MRRGRYLVCGSILAGIIIFFCGKEPSGPSDVSDELKRKGTISGTVYSKSGQPIKDVLVSINADSATPGLTNSSGMFTVGRVLAGTYTLRFTHRDYEDDTTHRVTVGTAEDLLLKDTISLSYAYYRLQGKVVYNTKPVPGAGVALTQTPLATMTDDSGRYLLDRVPKNLSLRLLCAKDTLGYQVYTPTETPVPDGTTNLQDISLDKKGADVSGTVFGPDGLPAPFVWVKSIGGGIKSQTSEKGTYLLKNVPVLEQDIRIYVDTQDSVLTGAVTGIMLDPGGIATHIDIYLRYREELVNGMYLNVQNVVTIDTAGSVRLNVFPTTACTTVIASYTWRIGVKDTVTTLPLLVYPLKIGAQSFNGSVQATSSRGLLSARQSFLVSVFGSRPLITRAGVSKGNPDEIYDTLTVNKGTTVFFIADIHDPIGGIDSTWWYFGNGDFRKTGGIFQQPVPYAYGSSGNFMAIVKAMDTDSQSVSDTMLVRVNTPPEFSATMIFKTTAAAGLKYRFVLYADDKDNDTVRFRLLLPVPGIIMSEDTILWIPQPADTGVHAISAEAYDGRGGADTAVWTITVSKLPATNAFLDSIIVSSGELSPKFDSTITAYYVAVPSNVEYFRIKPLPKDPAASLAVNSKPLAIGKYTDFVKLTAGRSDTFGIVVVAQDCITQRSYRIIVTRDMSKNAKLAGLRISDGFLMPDFNPDITRYTDSVGYDINYVTITPSSIDPNSTIRVNDMIVPSGDKSKWIQLKKEPDTITIVVTAEDTTNRMTYLVMVNHKQSNNTSLANLTLSVPGMQPMFHPDSLSYRLNVQKSLASITVTPTLFDNGKVTVNGNQVLSGTSSSPIILKGGPNLIEVVVTALDGVSTRKYTITVTRDKGTSANLFSLTSPAVFNPSFSNSIAAYYDTVEYEAGSYALTPVSEDPGAIIIISGDTVVSGTAHSSKLTTGTNNVPVKVIAEDLSNKKDFSVLVTRRSDVSLAGMSITGGAVLSPAFHPESLTYACTVENDTASVRVLPTASQPGLVASITVNNVVVPTGTLSQPQALNVGLNQIPVKVTGTDGFSTRSYVVKATRKASSIANLTALTVSKGTLRPAFNKDTLVYYDTVDISDSIMTVTPTKEHPASAITVNNNPVNSGTATQVPINYGSNTISVRVTAGDNSTTKTYTVYVTRKPNSIVKLASLVISSSSLTPSLDTSGADTVYTGYVPYEVSTVTVTPACKEPRAKIEVNGTIVASGSPSLPVALNVGANTITVTVTALDGVTKKNFTVTITRQKQGSTIQGGLLVTGTDTLRKANSPYWFQKGILVQLGGTLVIEPGVALLMDSAVAIDIQGTLIARGTGTDSIYFKAYNSSKQWGYLLFSDSATDAAFGPDSNYVSGCILEYCVVEYAGSKNKRGTVCIENASPFINYSSIRINAQTGIYTYGSGSNSKINFCNINNNKANYGYNSCGGGIYISYSGNIIITNCIISNNTAPYFGSGGATGGDGGGIYANQTSGNIINCTISNNMAQRDGGGIYNSAATLINIINCTISNNTASAIGGGIYNAKSITHTIIRGNSANYYSACILSIINSDSLKYNTITGNKTTGTTNTSAIYISGNPVVSNNNFVNDTATYELQNANAQGTPNLNAKNNYWGTTDENTIKAKICDFFDDNSKGVVDYSPFLTAPDPDAPPITTGR